MKEFEHKICLALFITDYEAVYPHNSFIHVNQFKGRRELTEYLLELDMDEDKYNQFFMVRHLKNSEDWNIKKKKSG